MMRFGAEIRIRQQADVVCVKPQSFVDMITAKVFFPRLNGKKPKQHVINKDNIEEMHKRENDTNKDDNINNQRSTVKF